VLIIMTMLILGVLFGFTGVGGAGFVIAVLTTIFKVPVHTALGTSLAAMAFTTISGAYSHYREGNMHLKIGLIVGSLAAVGSFIGANIASLISGQLLTWFTASMLFLSALLLFVKIFIIKDKQEHNLDDIHFQVVVKSIVLGFISGVLAGTFGIGSAPFIQIGLLIFLNLTLRQSIGTTMLVIIPISIGGGIGYLFEGYVDFLLLSQVLVGTLIGAYIGAKFTNLAPSVVLKTAIFFVPIAAGIIMII
jgi:uncharacterized protein